MNEAYKRIKTLIVTTGDSVDGYRVVEYLGVVSGECALGTGFLKGVREDLALFDDDMSSMSLSKIKSGKEMALHSAKKEADQLGANALIGVELHYTKLASDIIVVVCTGTAVRIEKI